MILSTSSVPLHATYPEPEDENMSVAQALTFFPARSNFSKEKTEESSQSEKPSDSGQGLTSSIVKEFRFSEDELKMAQTKLEKAQEAFNSYVGEMADVRKITGSLGEVITLISTTALARRDFNDPDQPGLILNLSNLNLWLESKGLSLTSNSLKQDFHSKSVINPTLTIHYQGRANYSGDFDTVAWRCTHYGGNRDTNNLSSAVRCSECGYKKTELRHMPNSSMKVKGQATVPYSGSSTQACNQEHHNCQCANFELLITSFAAVLKDHEALKSKLSLEKEYISKLSNLEKEYISMCGRLENTFQDVRHNAHKISMASGFFSALVLKSTTPKRIVSIAQNNEDMFQNSLIKINQESVKHKEKAREQKIKVRKAEGTAATLTKENAVLSSKITFLEKNEEKNEKNQEEKINLTKEVTSLKVEKEFNDKLIRLETKVRSILPLLFSKVFKGSGVNLDRQKKIEFINAINNKDLEGFEIISKCEGFIFNDL